jgi:hypothetical protein
LREVLAHGPVPAKEAQEEARGAGIAERTLKRARSTLGVAAERRGEPGQRGGGRWYWRLPQVKGAKPEGWPPKTDTDRTDAEESPCPSQKNGAGLRGPNNPNVKEAGGVGTLNIRPSEGACKLLKGPPGWLQRQIEHARKQGFPETQLKALAAAVARETLGDGTKGAEVMPVVEAFLTHGVGCDCEECA